MAKRATGDGAVEHPLTPDVLTDLGALAAAPVPAGPFDPAGDWAASYRIWTSYGRRDGGNLDVGALEIERRAAGAGHRLAVRQTLFNAQGKRHTLRAEVECATDALGSPAAWTLASAFEGARMDGLPPMETKESGRIAGDSWETAVGADRQRRPVRLPVTADWCLLEAVQRMAFREGPALGFDVLEGLSALKHDHRLWYAGRAPATWGPASLALHRFVQVGRGVYPYEYWLDEGHRLLLAVTGPRAYILGARA